MSEDVLRQVLDAIRTTALSYDDFRRRLGLDDGARAWQLWEAWRRLQNGADQFTGAALARLLANDRPFTAEEILKNEG